MNASRNRLRSLWDMYKLDGPEFLRLFGILAAIQGLIQASGQQYEMYDIEEFDAAINHVDELLELCSDVGLEFSIMSIERFKAILSSKENMSYSELGDHYKTIEDRIRDEFSAILLFSLEKDKAKFYDGEDNLFGSDVETKFASVAYEIDEAGKCYALDRSTASAFHSIRCLEAGIRALSRCLGIPDPTKAADRSWFKMLKAIKDEMDKKWPKTVDRMQGDGRLFEDLYASLAAMQNPWRNATMHLDQKYTEEEALHIFEVVGGFMRKLASRMDENGQPLA